MNERHLPRKIVNYDASINDGDRAEIALALEASRKERLEKYELLPLPEELQALVVLSDTLIEAEMSRLGLTDFETLNGQNAFMSKRDKGKENKLKAVYIDGLDVTVFFDEILKEESHWKKLFLVLHERVHHHSQRSLSFIKLSDDHILVNSHGLGYQYKHQGDTGPELEYFTGVVEALTERMAAQILFQYLANNLEELAEAQADPEFTLLVEDTRKTSLEDDEFAQEYYWDYIKILNTIFDEVAKDQGITREEVWEKWERGLFTKERMHMRHVDHTFGAGSLRFLSAIMSNGMKKHMNTEDEIGATVSYFSTKDHDIHRDIAKRALRGKERKAWLHANGYFKDKE